MSDPRAIVGLVEQERMRHEEMARREQEVSEKTTSDRDRDYLRRFLGPRGLEQPGSREFDLGKAARITLKLLAECDGQAKRIAELEEQLQDLDLSCASCGQRYDEPERLELAVCSGCAKGLTEEVAELTERAEKAEAKVKELEGLRFVHERACQDYAARVLRAGATGLRSRLPSGCPDGYAADVMDALADRIRKGEV